MPSQWINGSCGKCEACARDGDILRCGKPSYSGGTVDGTFQEYCICKARSAVRIPKYYDLELAAPVSRDQTENTVRRLSGTGSLCWCYVLQSNP